MSEIYVLVLYDYQYSTKEGKEIKIKAGEELLLLKKSNENWWEVIRNTDGCSFYAPSSYLSIIGLHCKKTLDDACNGNLNFLDDSNSCFSSHLTNNSKPALNRDIDDHKFRNINLTSKDADTKEGFTFMNNFYDDEIIDFYYSNNHVVSSLNGSNGYDSSSSAHHYTSIGDQDSSTPVYANLSVCIGKAPPIPRASDAALRKLSNDWCEYLDEETSRKYYYHATSGKVTWKPPGRQENLQSTPLNSEPNSPKFGDSSSLVPEPPPKQLKPKLEKLTHSSTESLESSSPSCMFTILPSGWSQESDSKTGAIYYSNDLTPKKWYSSVDETGHTYFYEEDSAESVWELPDLTISFEAESKEKKLDLTKSSFESSSQEEYQSILEGNADSSLSPKFKRKAPKIPAPRKFKTRSLVMPECVDLGSGDKKGFLPASFSEGYWPSVQDGHFSITHKGTLNKTKLGEGGRRVKKNWTSSFVVLTDVVLLFFKDMQTAHLGTPGIKPELLIDLNGALVEWCPEKSSRKNVFQISTVFGQQLLLQDDNAQTTREWFETIQNAIMKLPSSLEQASLGKGDVTKKEIKLSRSKSTKNYPPCKNFPGDSDIAIPADKKRKIRDKLRQFFVRRPTLESLREKGILIDELVFGCHLEVLCAKEKRKVPKFVSKCIEAIENKELTADGLYRASGNLSQVQKIRIQVNQDDYTCLDNEEDVHVLTGALKMFFREMKEPLFPWNMFDKFLTAIALPDATSKLEALKELVKKLPEPNYETLKDLFEHLLRVTKYHKQNRMQVQNLAIVFGPTLLCSEHLSNNIALDMMHQNRVIEFLLLEFDAIFLNEN